MDENKQNITNEVADKKLKDVVGGVLEAPTINTDFPTHGQPMTFEPLKCPHCGTDLGILATPGFGAYGTCPNPECGKRYVL